jgi:hypothetical protein
MCAKGKDQNRGKGSFGVGAEKWKLFFGGPHPLIFAFADAEKLIEKRYLPTCQQAINLLSINDNPKEHVNVHVLI